MLFFNLQAVQLTVMPTKPIVSAPKDSGGARVEGPTGPLCAPLLRPFQGTMWGPHTRVRSGRMYQLVSYGFSTSGPYANFFTVGRTLFNVCSIPMEFQYTVILKHLRKQTAYNSFQIYLQNEDKLFTFILERFPVNITLLMVRSQGPKQF